MSHTRKQPADPFLRRAPAMGSRPNAASATTMAPQFRSAPRPRPRCNCEVRRLSRRVSKREPPIPLTSISRKNYNLLLQKNCNRVRELCYAFDPNYIGMRLSLVKCKPISQVTRIDPCRKDIRCRLFKSLNGTDMWRVFLERYGMRAPESSNAVAVLREVNLPAQCGETIGGSQHKSRIIRARG